MIEPELVFASLGDAVLVVAPDGSVEQCNPAAERLLGIPAAELRGLRPAELGLHLPAVGPAHHRLALVRPGGDIQVVVSASQHPGGGSVLLIKDLSPWIGPAGRPAAAPEEAGLNELLGLVFKETMASGDLDPGEPLEELAGRLADQGRRLLPGTHCLIAMVPVDAQDQLVVIAGAGEAAAPLIGRALDRKGAAFERALLTGVPVEASDLGAAGPQSDLFAAAGLSSGRFVPMVSRHQLPDGRRALGLLMFLRRRPGAYGPDERRLVDVFAQLASVSLERAEFRARAERGAERLRTAVEAAFDLAESLDVREVVTRLLRRLMAAAEADRCALLRIDGSHTVVEDALDVEGHEDLIGFRQPVAVQPLMERAVRERRPMRGGGYDVSGLPEPLAAVLAAVRHTVTVPLVMGSEVAAALVLSRRRDLAFGEDELVTLRILGNVAMLALRNAWLFAETQEAARAKGDFLNLAAHELRTPLTVITGYLSLLHDGSFGPAPEAWGPPLEVLSSKAAELGRLVDDLLIAARLETDRLPPGAESLDLRDLAELAAELGRGRGFAVELNLPPDPVPVAGDPRQLERLLDHLVANAMAYGREGEPPWLGIEVMADSGQARIALEDRGRGIPAAERDLIFERFHRIDDRSHPPRPGTGLGLYIGRQLAQRHGGDLVLEWTEPGRGSRFGLRLPLQT